VARPALSASRTTAILDLLTAFPGRAFSMSEIVRATKINIASCHAVLNVLTDRGYLARVGNGKSYVLGPALVAVGQATLATHALIATAREAAAELARALQLPALLNTIVGGEILALSSIPDSAGRSPGMGLGQRIPLVPPAGAHFLAWAPDDAIEAWIARGESDDPREIAEWRHALALVRERGFQVTLRTAVQSEFAVLMAEMAAGRQPLEYKEQANSFIHAHSWHLTQPETIVADQLYDVVLIAAPIFDRSGATTLSLCLGGFADKLNGAEIIDYSNRLMRTCLQVMRDDRAA
jgi:DNA-binding IclR family transcriptional regulator